MVGGAGFRPQIIRSKQRVVTAISPHNGNDTFLIPKRMGGAGPAPPEPTNPQAEIYQQGSITIGRGQGVKYGYDSTTALGAQSGFSGLTAVYCDGGTDRFTCRWASGEVVNERIYMEDSLYSGRLALSWNGTTEYSALDQARRQAWETHSFTGTPITVTFWNGPTTNSTRDMLGMLLVGSHANPNYRYGYSQGAYGENYCDNAMQELYWDNFTGGPYALTLRPASGQWAGISGVYFADDTTSGRIYMSWNSGLFAYTYSTSSGTSFDAWKARVGQYVNYHIWDANLQLEEDNGDQSGN